MTANKTIARLLSFAQAHDMPADYIAFLWETRGADPLEQAARLDWLERVVSDTLTA